MLWRYRLDAVDGGTRVTEAYTVVRPITRMGWFIIDTVSGCKDRRGELAVGMAETLARLKALLEGAPAPRRSGEEARAVPAEAGSGA